MFKKANVRKRSKSHLNKGTADRDAGSDSHKTKQPGRLGKRLLSMAVLVMTAVAVPVIFATAEGSGQVATSAFIPMEQTASPSTLPSDASWDLNKENLPTTSDGTLTSDLTETTTQAAETVDPAASPAPEATPAGTAAATLAPESIYRTFSPGMDDPFIAQIQQRLMDLDYMEQDEPTTLLGPITSQAIQYFQRKNELPVDGIAGPQTQELLFSENAKYYTVLEGTTGPDVESIQERLKELGYSVNDTGYFGTDTAKAVAYFQRMNGLVDDGNVGSQTREALYSKNAEKSLEYGKNSSSTDGSKSSGSTSGSSTSGNASSGSASADSGSDTSVPAPNPGNVEGFIDAAFAQLGKPYVWGGKGPSVFDCSGFVYYALKTSGNGIGYMTSATWAQSDYPRIDKMEDLQRGDVICYKGHVGIYLGDGQMIDASSSQGKIRVFSNIFTSNYFTSHFICGRRVF